MANNQNATVQYRPLRPEDAPSSGPYHLPTLFSEIGADTLTDATTQSIADSLIDPRQSYNYIPIEPEQRAQKAPLPNIKDNSHGSRPLSEDWKATTLRIVIDLCLAVFPCLFIALAIVAAKLNDHEISYRGRRVENIARLGPTIYPIVFVAIVARLMRNLARWQAERGVQLGILEQLIWSQSFAGSIEAALTLRNLGIGGCSIVLVWAMSPVGGQSSLRLLSFGENHRLGEQPVLYPSSDTMTYFGGSSHYVTTPLVIHALLTSSLLAPNSTQSSATDTWGNVKIPAPDQFFNNTTNTYISDPISNSWQETDSESQGTSYSSLIGIPLWNIPEQGSANFSLESTFFHMDCHWQKPGLTGKEWCELSANFATADTKPCTWNDTDGSSSGSWIEGSLMTSNFSYNDSQLNSNSRLRYVTLQYDVYNPYASNNVSYSGSRLSCALQSVRVEANVICKSGDCGVKRVRRSEKDHRPDFLTVWNDKSIPVDPSTKVMIFDALVSLLPAATGTAREGYANPFDNYLTGQDEPFGVTSTLSWTNVTDTSVSKRFSQLLNTFWIASQWTFDITGNHAGWTNVSSLYNSTTGEPYNSYKEAPATISRSYQVYKANYLWITILLVVSIILLFCALASFVLRFLTLAPDMLGFVSSLTRDNEYFEPLPGGSAMGGDDRARRLREMKVQIVDVRPVDEVGYVAFTRADDPGRHGLLRLRKGRLYD